MAISTVQIANFALSKIGSDATIESLTENSSEANICNLWIEHTRLQALAAYDWSFARVRATLAAHGDDAPTDWAYRYIYPVDCVKARFLENPGGSEADPVPYAVEQSDSGSKSIVTDLNEAKLIYTKDVTVPGLYTPYFIEAYAVLLGAHVAYALTGKANLEDKLAGRARRMFIFAPALDASEQQEKLPRDAHHIRGRE
jgi:hypothetical protein